MLFNLFLLKLNLKVALCNKLRRTNCYICNVVLSSDRVSKEKNYSKVLLTPEIFMEKIVVLREHYNLKRMLRKQI